jgi:GNAT superfamily N-acetyltransferase
VARALLGAARDWTFGRGVKVIRGPFNPSTNYECGMLVEGFDSRPYVMMTHNPPYYARLLEQVGLRKAKDLWAYRSAVSAVSADKLQRIAGRALESNQVRVRPIRMRAFQEDVELLWKVYNAAWEKNWGFVPMTRDEFLHEAKEMKQILVPDLVLIGEVRDQVVGFALALPDINVALQHAGGSLFPFGLLKILYYQRKIRRLRVLALGVMERFRTAGVTAGFYAALIRNARRMGYQEAEMSWILEDNALMNRSLEAMGARKYKTYRIYEWN